MWTAAITPWRLLVTSTVDDHLGPGGWSASELVGRVGLDPTTLGLKVNRGTSHRQSPLTESACHLRCCSWC